MAMHRQSLISGLNQLKSRLDLQPCHRKMSELTVATFDCSNQEKLGGLQMPGAHADFRPCTQEWTFAIRLRLHGADMSPERMQWLQSPSYIIQGIK